MPVYLATKTLEAITKAIEADQGAAFREYLGKAIKDVGDAYDPKKPEFRSHFGVSQSGKPCARALWYSWRWVKLGKFSDRMLRLFNRGHLEEARFVAMLQAAGIKVFQADENGKQFRVSYYGGHYGSAIDGVAINVPDLPDPRMPCLLEFKTHNEKSFNHLVAKGLYQSKPAHFAQVQQYCGYNSLQVALYLAVCKNDDRLYGELVEYSPEWDKHYVERSGKIIFADRIPDKFSNQPSDFECRFCDMKMFCHYGEGSVARNCRTCRFSKPVESGQWICSQTGEVLDKQAQLTGCSEYTKHPDL